MGSSMSFTGIKIVVSGAGTIPTIAPVDGVGTKSSSNHTKIDSKEDNEKIFHEGSLLSTDVSDILSEPQIEI